MPERRIGFKRFATEVVQFTGDTLMAPISLAKLMKDENGIMAASSTMVLSLMSPATIGYLSTIIWFSLCGLSKEIGFQGRRPSSNPKIGSKS